MENAGKIDWCSPVEIKTILVPTDLRPESMIALRYALTLAKGFDANLTLLHVLEEPYTSDTELEPGAKELPVLKKGNEERELALLEDEIRVKHRNCRSCYRVGTPFRQIVHEAENIEASLIVISSHTYGWLERVVHGSTAEMILHHALCPVLVVKEPPDGAISRAQEHSGLLENIDAT
jgi:nucleotide-binding universal stress UspA family protein